MTCKNCGQETHKIMMMEVEGYIVQVCPLCPREAKKVEFPVVIVKGGTRTQDVIVNQGNRSTPIDNERFNQYALTPAEIAETQALRPKTRLQDNPMTRQRDSIDPFTVGKRAKVYVGGDHPNRGKKAMDDLRKKLGGDFKVISDNGFRVVGERIH